MRTRRRAMLGLLGGVLPVVPATRVGDRWTLRERPVDLKLGRRHRVAKHPDVRDSALVTRAG
jgi:hypothetical protein